MQKCIIVQQPERRLENKQNWLFGEGDPPPAVLIKKNPCSCGVPPGFFLHRKGAVPPPLLKPSVCPAAAPQQRPPTGRPARLAGPHRRGKAPVPAAGAVPRPPVPAAPSPRVQVPASEVVFNGRHATVHCHPLVLLGLTPPPRAQHLVFVIPSLPC